MTRSALCTFAARHKQAQEHYGHLQLVKCHCSNVAKRKYHQNLQEALREATRDYQSQKHAFEPGFFAPLSSEVRDDFEQAWCERTMERGWSEIPAPTAIDEHVYYALHERMKSDYIEGTNRRDGPDTTKQAT